MRVNVKARAMMLMPTPSGSDDSDRIAVDDAAEAEGEGTAEDVTTGVVVPLEEREVLETRVEAQTNRSRTDARSTLNAARVSVALVIR